MKGKGHLACIHIESPPGVCVLLKPQRVAPLPQSQSGPGLALASVWPAFFRSQAHWARIRIRIRIRADQKREERRKKKEERELEKEEKKEEKRGSGAARRGRPDRHIG